MIEMSWIAGLLGGLLIGGAAALFLLVNGRIMGASGLLGGVVDGTGLSTLAERLTFLAGLIALPALLAPITRPETHLTGNQVVVVIAGLAVGIGTRMANGCTSGHGVCGISRLSLRSIVATLIYLAAGALTMVLARHLLEVI
mgnify:CR=1 FL=1